MRVLIINPILYTSENDDIPKVSTIKDTMIYSLCMAFLKAGHYPVLAAASEYRPVSEDDFPFEVQWFPCIWKAVCKPRCLPMLKGLRRYLKENKSSFDFMIASEVFSFSSLTGVLTVGRPLMIWHELGAHNHILNQIPSRVWYNCIARFFMRNTVVIPRSFPAAAFISQYCRTVSDIIIDHGVDVEKIGGSSDKDDYFIVVSQLIARKRIHGIIKRFYDFVRQVSRPFQLKIIGDGVLREELCDYAKELGIDQYVRFYGRLGHEAMAPLLQKAKAMLVNTEKDNSMVSIVESIAAGTPVLSNSVPFNAAYIKSNQLGIIKDNWGLAELQEIDRNNSFYSKNCLAYREKLDSMYCVRQFEKIYERYDSQST